MTHVSSHATLVYDGDCGICTASAQWARRHVPGVDVVSHRQHGVDAIDKVWFIDDLGRHEGADAVARLLLRCPARWWRAVGHVLGAPVCRTVARGVYAVVARNRTRLSRLFGLKACSMADAPSVDRPAN